MSFSSGRGGAVPGRNGIVAKLPRLRVLAGANGAPDAVRPGDDGAGVAVGADGTG